MNGLILASQFIPLLGFLLIFLSDRNEKKLLQSATGVAIR